MQESIEQIHKIKKQAIKTSSALQPWPNYYRLRAMELEVLFSMYAPKKVRRILEIGCGNGFTSAILSGFSNEVIATDLYSLDRESHSIGILKAKELIKRLNVKNCNVISCSAEELPFKDKSVDLVFCAYTLEHIPKQNNMLREVHRILNISGETIFLLPNFMERIFHPFSFYAEMLKKIILGSQGKINQKQMGLQTTDQSINSKRHDSLNLKWRKFRKNYPHFPMPEPHGIYDNYFKELIEWFPSKWLKMFKDNGFKIESVFSTMLMPRAAIGIFTDSLRLYEKFSGIDKRLGNKKILRKIGQNLCIILKK